MPVHRPDAAKDVRNTHRHLSTLIPLATISDDQCSPLWSQPPRTRVAPKPRSHLSVNNLSVDKSLLSCSPALKGRLYDRKMNDKKIAATSCTKMPVHRPDAERRAEHLSPLIYSYPLSDDERRSVFPIPVQPPRTRVDPNPRPHLSVNNLSVDKNFSAAARHSKAVVRQKDGRQKDSPSLRNTEERTLPEHLSPLIYSYPVSDDKRRSVFPIPGLNHRERP